MCRREGKGVLFHLQFVGLAGCWLYHQVLTVINYFVHVVQAVQYRVTLSWLRGSGNWNGGMAYLITLEPLAKGYRMGYGSYF